MISSVSASENITETDLAQSDIDELSTIENGDIAAINDTETASSNEVVDNINITYDQQMWIENLSDIKVQLPDNANGTFCLKIGYLEVYNQTITNKTLIIPVKLPEPKFPYIIENIYPPRDCTNYKITAYYNGIELNNNQTLSVMKFPPNYEYWWGISDEILQYGRELWNNIMFPRSANGIVEIYLDGELINKTTVNGPYAQYDADKVRNLSLGNHTMKIIYYGDTYYHDDNRTLTFDVVNVKIDVPTNIYISHDDCVAVDILKNTSGKVNVYVDNVLIKTGKTDKIGSFIFSLEGYLKYNSSEVKVEFIGKDYSRTKVVPISIRYDFGYYDANSVFVYGEENIIELYLPDSLNNSILSVTINGTPFTFTHPEYIMNNLVEIDISKLKVGNYTIVISYPGDDKYVNRTEIYNFSVVYSKNPFIKIISSDIYTNLVNLKVELLDNKCEPLANTEITLRINGVNIKATTDKNGIAKIKSSMKLKSKEYCVSVKYNTTKISQYIEAKHVVALKTVKVKKSAKKLVLTATLKQGKKAIKHETVKFKFNGKTYKAKTNKKGVAKVTIKKNVLKKLKVGKKVKYQAKYLKDTVTKTAKVKR